MLGLQYSFTVPDHGSDRMGRDSALYEIAQWYPRMAVYDDVSADMKVRLYDKGVVKQRSLGRYETFARFQMLARAGDILVPKVEFREPLALEIDHFAECIVRGRTPLTDGAAGRRVVAVLEAAQRSLESNGGEETVVLARTTAVGGSR